MLVIEDLSRRFGQKSAVDNVSLSVEAGSFVGVIGRSGAGKSTLLRMINRLQDPSGGRIVVDGLDVTDLKGQALRDWRAYCAMIFQQFNLVGRLDVLTNVLMGRLNKVSTATSRPAPVERRGPGHRAVGARTCSTSPASPRSAPTASPADSSSASRLPARSCRSPRSSSPTSRSPRSIRAIPSVVMDALLRINKHYGITVLCNLHSLDLARAYCDRLVGMAAGRIVFDGAPGRAHRRCRARALRLRSGRRPRRPHRPR